MASDSGGTFSCEACGRSYPWTPQIAGRQAKCNCGAMMKIPAMPARPVGAAAPAGKSRPVTPPADDQTIPLADGEDPATIACPSCRNPIKPGAVLCVSCGFNVRTGQHMGTAVAPRGETADESAVSAKPAAGATVYPGYRSRRAEEEPAATNNKLYMILGIVVLAIAMGVGGLIIFRKTGGPARNVPMLGKDAQVAALIKEDGGIEREARQWMKDHEGRMLSGWTRAVAEKRLENIYNDGAVRVLAFGNLYSRVIAIELPSDPAKRKALVAWQKTWHEDVDRDSIQTDVGQRYLLITLKP